MQLTIKSLILVAYKKNEVVTLLMEKRTSFFEDKNLQKLDNENLHKKLSVHENIQMKQIFHKGKKKLEKLFKFYISLQFCPEEMEHFPIVNNPHQIPSKE